MASRISTLENTVLELGTELFKLKNKIGQLDENHSRMNHAFSGLKAVLDEKGVITQEDFDSAVELGDYRSIQEPELEDAAKKTMH